jgi:hypothetical protein
LGQGRGPGADRRAGARHGAAQHHAAYGRAHDRAAEGRAADDAAKQDPGARATRADQRGRGLTQYYQDVSDKNYAAAWAIGGSNLATENGQTYDSWVAGYADTTASISITSYGTWSNGTVWCYISAVQDSGAVNTYYGTYTVANGVIVSASIRQAG